MDLTTLELSCEKFFQKQKDSFGFKKIKNDRKCSRIKELWKFNPNQ
jgi:hypothetical protein